MVRVEIGQHKIDAPSFALGIVTPVYLVQTVRDLQEVIYRRQQGLLLRILFPLPFAGAEYARPLEVRREVPEVTVNIAVPAYPGSQHLKLHQDVVRRHLRVPRKDKGRQAGYERR